MFDNTPARIGCLLLLLSFPLLALPQSSQLTQSTKGSSQYVGAETCKSCHEDEFNSTQRTPHAKAHTYQHGEQAQACESCHGPGAEHVANGGDKTKIFSFTTASTGEINQRCLSCHSREHQHSAFQESAHSQAKLSCSSCHSPHHASERRGLLKQNQPSLCYSCHAEVRAEFSKEFRHRVNDGLIRCSDCHNVHAASTQSVSRSPEQDQVCFKCHRQVQGPFVFEHVPVKTEGCMSCHQPHGSVNPRMLRINQVNLLCLQCHTPGTVANTKAGETNAPGTPNGPIHDQTMKFQACTMCHVFIHGSNADETFMK